MNRRKGELSSSAIDREYPHQVIVPWAVLSGGNYHYVRYFCEGLSVAPGGHSIVKNDEWHHVFCFRDKADSLAEWDMRDGKQDCTQSALAVCAKVFVDDFLLFDVAKPITDASHFEIEKSTLNGKAYQTGGGRTVDSDVIDILLTWTVNHDREFLEGGTTKATKPGQKLSVFCRTECGHADVVETVDVSAAPDKVWELIGQFGVAYWHPLIAKICSTGTGLGQLRTIETIDGKQIIERLEAVDNAERFYRYTNIAGLPVANYTGILSVKPNGAGSSVEWSAQFLPNGPGALISKTIVSTLFKAGLDSLKSRF